MWALWKRTEFRSQIRNINGNRTENINKLQILNFSGLTYSQETKGHPAEEPGGHGSVGQEEPSPRPGPSGHEAKGRASGSSELHKVE